MYRVDPRNVPIYIYIYIYILHPDLSFSFLQARSDMSELERMEAELEQCGSMDLLCAARREKGLKGVEKKRALEEKLKNIAKKKKKARAKAKRAGA